ncbi:alanine racemase [Aeromicrobium endophyticum]|uniref:Alanine racemase n=1 Tax=Aeromicrobium endophyticum TaxID=2292704 RepID=A0A371P3I8_9ACTN|nr:alanine racemase [Aeromicrobium endophyticum]REK69966.1 alanine racemase [Aeromicrobium endophyticum]
MTEPAHVVRPEPSLPGPRLEIDLEAIADNTRLLADRARGSLMAVVKADGFGHGLLDVATTALTHGATSLGVTSLGEAMALRSAGIAAPVLSWLSPPTADFRPAVAAGVELAAPSLEHLRAIRAAADAVGRPALVHLHADTGLARDGASPDAWQQLCQAAAVDHGRGRLRVVGLMGHLACADRPGDPANAVGREAFARFVATARAAGLDEARCHLAATAATLTDPSSHHDLCRVGAGLVGIDPSGTTMLRSAMTLRAPLVSVRSVPAGTGVGYGHTHVTERRTSLGLLPVGYADGIPRSSSGRGEVLVHGRRCRTLGLVSMDQTVVDLGDLPARPGDTVTVMGPGDDGEPTVTEWAAWSQSLPHDVVTGFGPRVARTIHAARSPRLRAVSALDVRSRP